jgi:hypothetical protein
MRTIGLAHGVKDPLLGHPMKIHGVPNDRYDGNALRAEKSAGKWIVCSMRWRLSSKTQSHLIEL